MRDFTKGPWVAKPHGVVMAGREQVAMATLEPTISRKTQEANAALMAAAPDMLALLKALSRRSDLPGEAASLIDTFILDLEGIASHD